MIQKRSTPRNKGADNRADPLRQALERLASEDAGALRSTEAKAAGFTELIDQIAREVDETVLPRNLVLLDGDEELAMLTISNRRLVAVRSAKDHGAKNPSDAADAAEAAKEFLEKIHAISEEAGPIRLRLKGRVEGFSVNEMSCSASDLMAAAREHAQKSRLDVFLADVRKQAEAWVFRPVVGADVKQDGPDELCEALATLEREFDQITANQGEALRRTSMKPNCTFIPYTQDRRFCVAVDGESALFAVVAEPGASALMNAWRKAYRI